MLEKYDYRPTEVIKGTVSINLKKPTQARKLEVALLGKIKTVYRNVSAGHYSTQTQYQTVYDFKIPLAGEKDYEKEQYQFEMK